MTPHSEDTPVGSAPRPSLRSVATKAGVSAMTVSRVLRNHPSVSGSVRTKVQHALRALGYIPDPEVVKLMHHLRRRRKPAFQSSICALTTRGADARPHFYFEGVEQGAEERANELGYTFNKLQIGTTRESWRTLPRILQSRGVEGILLLPMALPISLKGLLNWKEFSVVTATLSVLSPDLHSVQPHHFRNARLLSEKLTVLGYRRIGIVANSEQTQRTNHALNSAVIWHSLLNHGNFVPPLLYSGATPADLEQWFRRERPDVIVTHVPRLSHEFAARLGLSIPGPVGFVTSTARPGSEIAGINERPQEVGAAAINLLANQIHRGVRGIPALPTTTQIPGFWIDAPSCSRRKVDLPPHRPTPGGPAVYLEK